MKRAIGPAEVYARSEVEAILTAPRQPRDRVIKQGLSAQGCEFRSNYSSRLATSTAPVCQLRVRHGKGVEKDAFCH